MVINQKIGNHCNEVNGESLSSSATVGKRSRLQCPVRTHAKPLDLEHVTSESEEECDYALRDCRERCSYWNMLTLQESPNDFNPQNQETLTIGGSEKGLVISLPVPITDLRLN